MKTYISKLINGILMAILLMLAVHENSFAQFQMGNTLAPLTGNSYPIIFTNDSKGGHHQVATIADRDNITTLRRQPGMLCTVMNDGSGNHKTYQLICADTKADRDNNANWVVFASTGGNTTTPSGNSWLYGIADPLTANGNIGDFYLNTTNNTVFGPKKADNTWPVLQLQGSPTGVAGGDLSGLYPNPAIAEKAISTLKIADGAVTTVKLGEKAVTATNIADQAVGVEQLKVGLADQVLVTNAAGTAVVWINKSDFLSAVDNVTLTGAGTVANPFKVKDLGILTSHLADGAVTEAKLSADAVTTLKVKNAAVTEDKLADDAVSSIKIKDDAVTGNKVVDGAVTETKIATGAVTSDKLSTDAVGMDKIKDGAVGTGKIADGAVTTLKLGGKAVTTSNIADQAVGVEQLKVGLADQVLVTNTAGTAVVWINKSDFLSAVDDVTLSGAGTVANPFKVKDLGILTSHLADGAVTEAKLSIDAVTTLKVKNAAVTEEKLADDAVSSIKIKDGAVTETKLVDGAVKETKIATGAVTTDKLADNSITPFKMQAGAANMVLVTDPSGTSVIWVDKSALASVVDMETIIGNGTIGDPFHVKDTGIITRKIADLAVTTEKIADQAVSTIKLADKAITTEKIADKAITVAQIKEGAANQILTTNAEGAVAWADNTGGTASPGTFNGSRAITGDYYKGVNPNTNDIAKWLEAVFYPSTVPTVSIVPTPGLGTREMASAGTNTVSLKWTATRVAGTAEIKQVTVDGVVVSTTTPAENASVTGTTTGTITNNTAKTFTVVATTSDGKTASASASVSFQWKIYYGFITGGDDGVAFNPTDAQIIALSGDLATSKALKKQVTPTGSQKLVIAYPSSWGEAAILAGVNDSTGAFDKTTRSFTNASGGTISYLIYVQKDNTAAGYLVTVQ